MSDNGTAAFFAFVVVVCLIMIAWSVLTTLINYIVSRACGYETSKQDNNVAPDTSDVATVNRAVNPKAAGTADLITIAGNFVVGGFDKLKDGSTDPNANFICRHGGALSGLWSLAAILTGIFALILNQ